MRPEIKAALIGLGGSLGAALIAAAVALYTAGKKSNEATNQPSTIMSNFHAGAVLVNPLAPVSLSFPVAALPAQLPGNGQAPLAKATIPENIPAPVPPTVIPVDVGTSTEILDRCTGFEPLMPSRVTVMRTTDGYTAAIDLKNTTKQVMAVYSKFGGAPFALTAGGQTLTTPSNIRDEGKFTFFIGGVTPEKWDGAFKTGLQVDPTGSMHIEGHFRANGTPAGSSANLSMTLLYLYKDENGMQLTKTRSPQCSAIPISEYK